MKFAIFGLSISSSWGNGHATLWRGLCGALARRGHEVIFFERDQPYYASHRDFWQVQRGQLVLYDDWRQVLPLAASHLSDADVGMVTSYCPDGVAASDLVLESKARIHSFYDLDAPITLSRLNAGLRVDYIPERGLRDFDLVLSYAGGRTLDELRIKLGARRVAPLYGSVDPSTHYPVPPKPCYQADLSYMGTYSPDRDAALRVLFIKPARRLPLSKFLIGGSKYDGSFPWQDNVYFIDHIPVSEHSAFYCSSRLTLNATRQPMAEMGYCPSGRLFEATACGAVVLSDIWPGIETFFQPGSEILLAHSTDDVLEALRRPSEELSAIGRAARERTLDEHTADVRVRELEEILDGRVEDGKPRSSVPLSVAEMA